MTTQRQQWKCIDIDTWADDGWLVQFELEVADADPDNPMIDGNGIVTLGATGAAAQMLQGHTPALVVGELYDALPAVPGVQWYCRKIRLWMDSGWQVKFEPAVAEPAEGEAVVAQASGTVQLCAAGTYRGKLLDHKPALVVGRPYEALPNVAAG